MKTCIKCLLEKPESQFNWKVRDVKRGNTCKTCHSAYRKAHYQKNRQKYIDKARAWEETQGGKRAVRHKCSPEVWEELVSRFSGMCWLCKTRPAVHYDHDHSCCPGGDSCGKCFRGALCPGCNSGLANLGDNLEGLHRAVEYLQAYENRQN